MKLIQVEKSFFEKIKSNIRISQCKSIYNIGVFYQYLKGSEQNDDYLIIMLDNNYDILEIYKMSVSNEFNLNVKLLLTKLLECNAKRLIIIQNEKLNHSLLMSLNKKISNGCNIIDVILEIHLIISQYNYYTL